MWTSQTDCGTVRTDSPGQRSYSCIHLFEWMLEGLHAVARRLLQLMDESCRSPGCHFKEACLALKQSQGAISKTIPSGDIAQKLTALPLRLHGSPPGLASAAAPSHAPTGTQAMISAGHSSRTALAHCHLLRDSETICSYSGFGGSAREL